jgi:hypothetical protein
MFVGAVTGLSQLFAAFGRPSIGVLCQFTADTIEKMEGIHRIEVRLTLSYFKLAGSV